MAGPTHRYLAILETVRDAEGAPPVKGKHSHNLLGVFNALHGKQVEYLVNAQADKSLDLEVQLVSIRQGLDAIQGEVRSKKLSLERAEAVNGVLNYLEKWIKEIESKYKDVLK